MGVSKSTLKKARGEEEDDDDDDDDEWSAVSK